MRTTPLQAFRRIQALDRQWYWLENLRMYLPAWAHPRQTIAERQRIAFDEFRFAVTNGDFSQGSPVVDLFGVQSPLTAEEKERAHFIMLSNNGHYVLTPTERNWFVTAVAKECTVANTVPMLKSVVRELEILLENDQKQLDQTQDKSLSEPL